MGRGVGVGIFLFRYDDSIMAAGSGRLIIPFRIDGHFEIFVL